MIRVPDFTAHFTDICGSTGSYSSDNVCLYHSTIYATNGKVGLRYDLPCNDSISDQPILISPSVWNDAVFGYGECIVALNNGLVEFSIDRSSFQQKVTCKPSEGKFPLVDKTFGQVRPVLFRASFKPENLRSVLEVVELTNRSDEITFSFHGDNQPCMIDCGLDSYGGHLQFAVMELLQQDSKKLLSQPESEKLRKELQEAKDEAASWRGKYFRIATALQSLRDQLPEENRLDTALSGCAS
jgi:hypothetical protein